MPGKHTDPQPSPEPEIVMHEDDPVLVKHYPTKLTRQNVKRFAVIGAIVTFGLVIFTGWQLFDQQNQLKKERQVREQQITTQVRRVACAVAAPYPDTIPYVREFRSDFHCPPYDPHIAKRLKPSPTPSPTPNRTPKYSGIGPVLGKTVLLTPNGQNGISAGRPSTDSHEPKPVSPTLSASPTSSPRPSPTPSPTQPGPSPSPSPTGLLPITIQTLCSIELVDILAC